jgi:peptidoglycan/LPS O-acetylase OafA/YrhL
VRAVSSESRIPSLDGLRALSIGVVLVSHLEQSTHFFSQHAVAWLNPGDLGVRTFFVISGFLITTLLLREIDRTGTISLRTFYIRRALRIFPAMYAYIGFIALFAAFGWIELGRNDLLHALTYTTNYTTHPAWYVGHLWSLSVEEQFYLLWPATLFLTGRVLGMRIALMVILVVPLIRIFEASLPQTGLLMFRSFETSCDALAAGCLLAGVRDSLGAQRLYLRFLWSPFPLLLPLGILLGSMSFIHPRVQILVGAVAENVCIALLIDFVVRRPETFAGRILNARPCVYVGVLSYSLYLWQEMFCTQFRFPNIWWRSFPFNLGLAFCAALGSFYLIEQPFLRLRARFRMARVMPQKPLSVAPADGEWVVDVEGRT